MSVVNLMDLTPEQSIQLMKDMGQPSFRGKQLYKWIHQKGVSEIEEMTDMPASLRARLAAVAITGYPKRMAQQISKDGTAKYLFGFSDGNAVESVFLPHEYGLSVCVSSQVGCRMGCRFCASTIGGIVRNLTAGEIYGQVMAIGKEGSKRVDSIVIMGSGEPLDNYDQVLKFIRMVISPEGLNIGARHITLSTCGLVPEIKMLAEEKLQITLSVSLHAPNDEIRDQIMPVNKKYPLQTLIRACKEYTEITGRRVTFEYSLIDGVNDSPEQARELAQLLKGMLCHVNLIPLNQVRERNLQRTTADRVKAFKSILDRMGIGATVRKEMGGDIDAACGQLRRKILDSDQS